MNGEPDILSTAELAKRFHCTAATVRRRASRNVALRGCIVHETPHSTEWSVQRLRDRGFLTRPEPVAAPLVAGMAFTYELRPLAMASRL